MHVKSKFLVKIFLYFVLFENPTLSNAFNKSQIKERITGGYRPEKHVWAKHMVSIRVKNREGQFQHNCAGSILKPRVIVTAAHCVTSTNADRTYPINIFEIVAGSPLRTLNEDSKIFHVERVIAYPKYDNMIHKHDVALIYLTQDMIEDGEKIQRIELITEKPVEGSICTAAGWGRILNNGPIAVEVTYVDLTVFAQEWCYKHFHGVYGEKIICAKDQDEKYTEKGICNGDSGGPLFCSGVLAGISSLGRKECGASGYVDVYTNVMYFRDWIQNRANLIQILFKQSLWLAIFVMRLI